MSGGDDDFFGDDDALGAADVALTPGQRLYTVADADALVPHLVHVFDEFDYGREAMQALVMELGVLGVQVGKLIPPALADDPRVRPHLEELADLNERLQALVTELGELGVEVKGLDGLVDVKSRYEGRIVYLCWRRGEPGFRHWHDLEAGFTGRVPIVDPDAFEGTLLI